MFPAHDPYHILIPKLAAYFGYNVELTDMVNHPMPRQNCNFCNEISRQLAILLNGWRPYLHQVRNAYNCVPTSFDYNSRYQRGIYMLAYFPFYIEPIYYSFENFANDFDLNGDNSIDISILGGGALPELIGLSKLIDERRRDIRTINVKVFDKYQNWNAEIENCTKELIPYYHAGEVIISAHETDLLSLSDEDILNISNSDIVIMQNVINDLAPNNYNLLKESLLSIWDNFQQGAHMIIIDLNFNEVRQFMQSALVELINIGGLLVLPLNQIPIEHRPNIPFCAHLERMLFSNQHGLLPRRRVNYYRVIARK
jgi:hypothetical protein